MWPIYLTFLIFLGLLLIPLLALLLLVNFFAVGLTNLGLSAGVGILVVLAMILFSSVNLPLSNKESVKVKDGRFFGSLEREIVVNKGLSINLGGGVIPLFIVSILIPNTPLIPTLIATVAATLVAYNFSKVIPSVGVTTSPLFVVLTVAVLSLLLAPENPQIVAFVSGVLGTLIGADLMNIKEVEKRSKTVMAIGGGGVFDGIFLIGILSSFLAGI